MPSLHPTCPLDPRGARSPLYVVTAISNPWRYRSRYELYEKFAKSVADAGAILFTIEIAFGARPFEITDPSNPRHIQLRTDSEIWHKENLMNLGVERLPQNWEYVAFIDADILFARQDWVTETLNLLQHYDVIQMFSVALDLDPKEEPFQKHVGFVYSYRHGLSADRKNYTQMHPGFAWAMRRTAFNDLGGLIDIAVLGSADRHMAMGYIGQIERSFNKKLHKNYKRALLLWQERAEKYIRRNIGFMPGAILHYWHGKKRNRFYNSRWNILIDNQFDPEMDLKEDWQGLWQLTDRNIKLRDDIRNYFASRAEDSIDPETEALVHERKL